MTTAEALAEIAKNTAPQLTEDGIRAKIVAVQYIVHEVSTICIIEVRNGFRVIGHSAPASPTNFKAEAGKRVAYNDAFRQLWPLEGYLLKERLWHNDGHENAPSIMSLT